LFQHTGKHLAGIYSVAKEGRAIVSRDQRLLRRALICGKCFRHLTIWDRLWSKADLARCDEVHESGQIRAVVDRVLPLAEARKAQVNGDRAQFGKLVLKVSEARP